MHELRAHWSTYHYQFIDFVIKMFEDLACIPCPPEIGEQWCNEVLHEILRERVERIVRALVCIMVTLLKCNIIIST